MDLPFTRIFPIGQARLQENVDLYNMFNGSTILNENTRYTVLNNQWLNPVQIMRGRLLKFSAQLSF